MTDSRDDFASRIAVDAQRLQTLLEQMLGAVAFSFREFENFWGAVCHRLNSADGGDLSHSVPAGQPETGSGNAEKEEAGGRAREISGLTRALAALLQPVADVRRSLEGVFTLAGEAFFFADKGAEHVQRNIAAFTGPPNERKKAAAMADSNMFLPEARSQRRQGAQLGRAVRQSASHFLGNADTNRNDNLPGEDAGFVSPMHDLKMLQGLFQNGISTLARTEKQLNPVLGGIMQSIDPRSWANSLVGSALSEGSHENGAGTSVNINQVSVTSSAATLEGVAQDTVRAVFQRAGLSVTDQIRSGVNQ